MTKKLALQIDNHHHHHHHHYVVNHSTNDYLFLVYSITVSALNARRSNFRK